MAINSRRSRIFPSFDWPRCFYKQHLVRCCKIVNWFCRWRRKIEGTVLILKLFIVLNFSYIHTTTWLLLIENKSRIDRSSMPTALDFSPHLVANTNDVFAANG